MAEVANYWNAAQTWQNEKSNHKGINRTRQDPAGDQRPAAREDSFSHVIQVRLTGR
jgi:hypothetical protein